MSLVGLMGKKRSGKDSFAATLVQERGFERFAFADPLKEAALALDPFIGSKWDGFWHGRDVDDVDDVPRLSDLVESEGWEAAKEWPEVRRILQNFGVGIRAIDEDFWLRTTLTRALDARNPAVITDVRFPNEADAIRENGGTLVRIFRPGLDSSDSHASETALDDYEPDVTVMNVGTLDELASIARSMYFG